MASSYTTNFGIEEMATGDQSGDWGTTTNFNFDILDRITAYKAVALSDASTATLTVREASPGSGTENLQDGMFRVIKFTGSLSQNCTITIAPNTTTAFFVFIDGTSGGFSLIFSQGSGDNYTLASGTRALVYCDGAGSGAAVAPALVEPLTTRGDIVVRNASNLTARLAVGSANYVVLTDGTDVAWGQVSLTAGVTGTLPTGNGGTGSTSTTYCALGTNVSGTLPVANGGTGATSLTDGGVLLGSGTGAVTALAVLADSEMIVGDGSTDPVAESGATLRTSIGVGTGDSPQFTAVNIGDATDTTLARSGSGGDLTVEDNLIYRAGGTDVPVADGGTGASTLTANYVLLGNGTSAPQMIAPGADGQVLTSTGSTWQSEAAGGGGGGFASMQVFTSGGTWTRPTDIVRIKVTVTGGGGGGGGSFETRGKGGGGGAGSTAIEVIDVTSLSSETVTIGAAGTAGASNAQGGTGGTSSFGSYNSAVGGYGGSVGGNGNGSDSNQCSGGTATGGDINIDGGDGQARGYMGSGDIALTGGTGGASFWGGGGRGVNVGGDDESYPGRAYGSGGSGGATDSGSGGSVGSVGKAGIMVIEEYK